MWDLFESLGLYQWQCECASETFICPSQPPYDLHVQCPCIDQFRDGCDHDSSYLHDVVLIANLLTMMGILLPIMMYLMKHMLDLMP